MLGVAAVIAIIAAASFGGTTGALALDRWRARRRAAAAQVAMATKMAEAVKQLFGGPPTDNCDCPNCQARRKAAEETRN